MAFEVTDGIQQGSKSSCTPLVAAGGPDCWESPPIARCDNDGATASPSLGETGASAERPPRAAGPQSYRRPAVTPGRTRTRKTLGSVLRARRRDLQLTQREVAAKLGVKPAHIAYLELDHRRPSLSLLGRIAEVLDLDRERLILLSHPEARSFIANAQKTEPTRHKDQAWRDFKRNKTLLARHKINKKEMRILSQVALLGRIVAPRNFLFILNSIRQAVEDEEI